MERLAMPPFLAGNFIAAATSGQTRGVSLQILHAR
jgi:hypothetical protein